MPVEDLLGPLQELLGHKAVEAGDDDAKPEQGFRSI